MIDGDYHMIKKNTIKKTHFLLYFVYMDKINGRYRYYYYYYYY